MLERIVDTTLRDGGQERDIVFSDKEKRRIVSLLIQAGIRRIEAGIPASGETERGFLSSLKDLPATIICWCRARPGDVEQALRCGTGAVHISFPVSPLQLKITGMSEEEIIEHLGRLVSGARAQADYVGVGAMDATRTATLFLRRFVVAALEAGGHMVRIADTVGIASPRSVMNLAEDLGETAGSCEFHGHNDLGMATANGLTALQSGFGAVSGTINGIGERAGNTALEELYLALLFHAHAGPVHGPNGVSRPSNLHDAASEAFHGGECYRPDRYATEPRSSPDGKFQADVESEDWKRLKKLAALCDYVSSVCGQPHPPRKPVTGRNAFFHQSGIHVAGLIKDPLAFQPFVPEQAGLKPASFGLGRSSGRSAVLHFFETQGITLTSAQAADLLARIRKLSEQLRRSLLPDEVLGLYRSFIDGRKKIREST